MPLLQPAENRPLSDRDFAEFFQSKRKTVRKLIADRLARHLGCVDRDIVDDLEQITFTQAWEKRDKFDPSRGKLHTWIYIIAISRTCDYLRTLGINRFERLDEPIEIDDYEEGQKREAKSGLPDPEEMCIATELAERVEFSLDMLPPGQQRAMRLELTGDSRQNIAAAIEITPKALVRRIMDARHAIAIDLELLDIDGAVEEEAA